MGVAGAARDSGIDLSQSPRAPETGDGSRVRRDRAFGLRQLGIHIGGRGGGTVSDPTGDLYPAARNGAFTLDRDLTAEEEAATYNNFYEFGSHKRIFEAAQALPIRPWAVAIDGDVEEPKRVDIDTLIRAMKLEERFTGIAASNAGRWWCRGRDFR